MFQGFTEEFTKVIMSASDETRLLGHNFVSTEQLLLGMISEENSVAGKALKSKGVTLEQARIEVEKIIGRATTFTFSPAANRALELAQEEAEQLGHNCIDAEHLLLGTLRVEDGIALRVLANLGVDATEIRDLVLRMLSEKTAEGNTEGSTEE